MISRPSESTAGHPDSPDPGDCDPNDRPTATTAAATTTTATTRTGFDPARLKYLGPRRPKQN